MCEPKECYFIKKRLETTLSVAGGASLRPSLIYTYCKQCYLKPVVENYSLLKSVSRSYANMQGLAYFEKENLVIL